MATVVLSSSRELKRAMTALGHEVEREVALAHQKAARFGATAVVRTSAKTSPRPRASGTYDSAWFVTKLEDGAVLENSAGHAYFVEVGRRPGKRPPFNPILEWVYQKRLAKRPRKGKRGVGPKDKKAPVNGAKIKKPKRPKRRVWAVTDAEAFAEAVRWKIAVKGSPGRFPLKRTMPAIAKRAQREVRSALKRVAANPPR